MELARPAGLRHRDPGDGPFWHLSTVPMRSSSARCWRVPRRGGPVAVHWAARVSHRVLPALPNIDLTEERRLAASEGRAGGAGHAEPEAAPSQATSTSDEASLDLLDSWPVRAHRTTRRRVSTADVGAGRMVTFARQASGRSRPIMASLYLAIDGAATWTRGSTAPEALGRARPMIPASRSPGWRSTRRALSHLLRGSECPPGTGASTARTSPSRATC